MRRLFRCVTSAWTMADAVVQAEVEQEGKGSAGMTCLAYKMHGGHLGAVYAFFEAQS